MYLFFLRIECSNIATDISQVEAEWLLLKWLFVKNTTKNTLKAVLSSHLTFFLFDLCKQSANKGDIVNWLIPDWTSNGELAVANWALIWELEHGCP